MYSKILSGEIHFPKKMSAEAKSFIVALLQRDPAERLTDPELIKQHKFFEDINWDKLAQREVQAPYIPPVKNKEDDSQISPEFTSESTNDSIITDETPVEAIHFEDFTYAPSSAMTTGA